MASNGGTKVYVKPLPMGTLYPLAIGWGVFRERDRRPYHSTTSLIEAKGVARRLGDRVLVLNAVGKIVEES